MTAAPASRLPRLRSIDSSAALMREGYRFVGERCRALGSDSFQTRLLLEPAICMRGPDAARFFASVPTTRRRALPRPMFSLLQDAGSVAALDGAAHHARKAMFLHIARPDEMARLEQVVGDEWRAAAAAWTRSEEVVLLEAVEELLCRALCRWAGVEVRVPEVSAHARELGLMVDGAGSLGVRQVRGQLARRRGERWALLVIRAARGRDALDPQSPLATIVLHRDVGGAALPDEIAAVELLNVLRPAVATARFVVFAAMALDDRPELRAELRGDRELRESFIHEVRRFYPFFPALAGRLTAPASWCGEPLPAGRRILLDLYGTNRHPDAWERGDEFVPDRFAGWDGRSDALVPQGCGDVATGHRCPGEPMVVAIMHASVRALAGDLTYEVEPQDLRLLPGHTPPRPVSGFVIARPRPAG
jgi:fatty-acid peroxygenase